jgi:Peptidase A4 family
VSTEFNVPKAHCGKTKGKTSLKAHSVHNSTAIWAGIDGAGSTYVEQGGMYMWCDTDSHAHYTGFWEMYRKPPKGKKVANSALAHDLRAVHPGDEMSVFVERLSNSFRIRVVDGSHWVVVKNSTRNGTAPDTSAETIIEPGAAYLTAYYGFVSAISSAGAVDPALGLGHYYPELDYCADGPDSTSVRAYIRNRAAPGRCARAYPYSTFNFLSSFSESIKSS